MPNLVLSYDTTWDQKHGVTPEYPTVTPGGGSLKPAPWPVRSLMYVSLMPCFALLLKPFHQPKGIFARLTMTRGRTHLDTAVVDP